jgi:DNA-binding Lrp family transcriptional regulator
MSSEPTGEQHKTTRTLSEEIEVSGGELLRIIKRLFNENNVRRIVIRYPNDEVMIEIPFAIGMAMGGGMALFNPALAFLAGLSAVLVRVKIEVVRVANGERIKE